MVGMRRLGDVAWRVLVLAVVWVVLGRAVGLLAGDTPDATIATAVGTTALWYATAGLVALRDGRRQAFANPYPVWALIGLLASLLCVVWQWAARSLSEGAADLLLLRDELPLLAPGLAVGVWACAAAGLALGRHDAAARERAAVRDRTATPVAAAQRPLTTSAARAIQEVLPPRMSSRRSAAR